ncbi:MAG: toprim domain-containing protein, partial [Nanoarchaeota archaeon]
KIYQQEYRIGKALYDVKVVGDCDKKDTGTEVTFFPDDTIFSTTKFEFSILETRFREIAFLNKGIKIILKDEISNKKEIFHYEGGLVEFVKWVNKTKEAIHAKPVYFIKEDSKIVVECAVQYNSGYQETVLSFVNTINTVEGGTHESGFKTALTRAINDYANKNKLNKSDNLTGDDVREGLTAIISVKVPEPQFEGQTKTKLGNSEVKGLVDGLAMKSLTEFFEENPAVARRIVDKALEAQKARNAAKKAKELVRRKNAFSVGGLPGKLADCASNKTEDSELFIVEGDSAGGCFSGNTEIALTNGRNISFEQLIEEDKRGIKNFCYTIKKDGIIGMQRIINPRLTKTDAEVMKITLDNEKEIVCTPDHKFMLRDGSYKEAKDITKEDSLMPLYEKEIDIVPKNNHKVKKIEKLNERINVYDIEVPETHNFALGSGIFVHNSAKMARNKEVQAILPLKGKPLNVEKANAVKVLSNEEIVNIITAIGTGVGDQFTLEKLRYGKIIIMTDADVDGAHIKTLLLTFFFRFMPKLIENGNIYIAVSPLYKIRKKIDHYVYSDEELKKIVAKLGGNLSVQRFKGLGEMNPEQLWDTTMNRKTRLLNKVMIEDAVKADETFSKLMGDDVEPRKQFISERASEAQIDI